jgi:hypothetical protein
MLRITGEWCAELIRRSVMLKRCAALIAGVGLVFTVACAQTDAGITTNV